MNPTLLFGDDYATIDAHQHELSQYASLPQMELAQKYHDALAKIAELVAQTEQLRKELSDAQAMLHEWEINSQTRPPFDPGY